MKINEKIRTLREDKNWSQEEMANKLEMSTNGYAKLERGETRLYLTKLEQIAEVFDIDVVELMSTGEKNLILYQESGNNQNCINIIGNSENEFLVQLREAKLTLSHKDEIIQHKNDIILALEREVEMLRSMIDLMKKS